MEAVMGLLMVLLGVSYGVETQCDATQNGAQCYGALGGTVVVKLVNTVSREYRYRWTQNKIITKYDVKGINITGNVVSYNLTNLTWTDSGEYSLETYNGGSLFESKYMQMYIQVPVSSPRLSSHCLSQGEMMVSCSSERGSSPRYSWTLDGRTLMDTELLSASNETNNITLKQGLSGKLSCSVSNEVSNDTVNKNISTCEGFTFINCTLLNGTYISQWLFQANNTLCNTTTTTTTPPPPPTTTTAPITTMGKETGIKVSFRPSTYIIPSNQTVAPRSTDSTDAPWYIKYVVIIAGSLSAVFILLLVAVSVYCFQMKKKKTKAQGSEDAQDVTYADVKVVQRQGRQMENKAEMEVEYSQVNVARGRRRDAEPTQDDCVYAMVRVNR